MRENNGKRVKTTIRKKLSRRSYELRRDVATIGGVVCMGVDRRASDIISSPQKKTIPKHGHIRQLWAHIYDEHIKNYILSPVCSETIVLRIMLPRFIDKITRVNKTSEAARLVDCALILIDEMGGPVYD